MKTTIVLPTYNETANLRRMVAALFDLPCDNLHLLIVDDGSPDGTGELAEQIAAERPGRVGVIHRPGKMGLGSAYRTGFRRALDEGADAIIQMDADFSHSPAYVPKMVEEIARGWDVVVGSRYAPGGRVDADWSKFRLLLSSGGNLYARAVTGLPVHDVTAGFKCWRADGLRRIPLDRVRSEGYSFQIEMAFLAQQRGLQARELPIVFRDRDHGRSKMSTRIVIEAFWRVWQIRFRQW